jgi:putative polymerase
LALKLINSDLDLKIVHDLAIILVFYLLGRVCPVPLAGRLVGVLLVLVIAIGLVGGCSRQCLRVCLIFGVLPGQRQPRCEYRKLQQHQAVRQRTTFGRCRAYPIAGRLRHPPHFLDILEPVSLGNFAIICLAWLLSMPPRSAGMRLTMAMAVGLCVVFPDSRFAAAACVMMVLYRMTFPSLACGRISSSGRSSHWAGDLWRAGPRHRDCAPIVGRRLFRTAVVFWATAKFVELAPVAWLAASPIYTADTGYAYAIVNMGLPLAIALWFAFAMTPVASRQGRRSRDDRALHHIVALRGRFGIFDQNCRAMLVLYGVTTQVPKLVRRGRQVWDWLSLLRPDAASSWPLSRGDVLRAGFVNGALSIRG